MPTRTIEELYPLVSWAIHRAEVAEARGDRSLAAATNLEVAGLEEEIAELLLPDNEEGAIARRAVVGAALAAGQYSMAVAMADTYLSEELAGAPQREKLRELRAKAQSELDAQGALPDTFEASARFQFAA